jgi:tetratricopeptide (TPR) repeat protein
LEKHVKPEIYRGLFRLYRDEDQAVRVLDALDEAFRVASAKDGAAKADEREAAQERLRAMLAVLRNDPALVGTLLEEAAAELKRSKDRKIDTWQLLATLAARTRKLQHAEQLFRNCLINLPPEHEFSVYSGLLEVLRLQKKYDEIVKVSRAALGGRRVQAGVEMAVQPRLASALAALGRYDEALTHADKAVGVSSEDRKVAMHTLKAEILAQAGRYDEAVSECTETLKNFTLARQVQAVRYTLSNVYSQKGDHASSEEQLRLVLETDPSAPLANNNLGYQMADRSVNLDEAERLIRRALDADRVARKEVDEEGERGVYLDSLGWVLFRQGKLAEARVWLEKAAALPDAADDPTVWDHLGDVYARLDLPAKAKAAWLTSVRLYKDDPRKTSAAKRAEVEKKLKSLD